MLEAKENRNPPPPNPIASYITVKIYFSRATHRSEILYKISAREISWNIRISRANPSEYGTPIRNIYSDFMMHERCARSLITRL